ncbi:peroxiredoxin-like family protein [Sphingomonas ginkgonis]|uniref:peroxiredoxin-like family protein n=1 Tax=Sphingomonas ginkgonis TaxID=2315330 RepID=UPI00163988E7|nr:peroxiredoxin-like family protein [Sphingomonas ginkgonis]
MTETGFRSIEQAFQQVRSSNLALTERLRVVADAARTLRPDYALAVDRFAERLAGVRAGGSAPEVGQALPLFALPDHDGRLVTLESLLGRAPLVVVFHRGHWCPFCRLSLAGLAEIEEAARPAQMVAISAELPRFGRSLRDECGAGFPFLTDMGAGYALSLGLAVWIDEQLAALIAEAGWDIPLYQGGADWVLPIPTVFLLDERGFIRFRHIDPDYRRQLEPARLLAEIRALASPSP